MQIRNVIKSFTRGGESITVLRDLNLTVALAIATSSTSCARVMWGSKGPIRSRTSRR